MGRVVGYSVVFYLIGNFCGQMGPLNFETVWFYNGVLLSILGAVESIAWWRRRRQRRRKEDAAITDSLPEELKGKKL